VPEERPGQQGGLKAELLARARSALAAIEAVRERLDDLNVYPVPDGDTGTNLAASVRAIVEAIESAAADDRPTLAGEIARAALVGARGNSGVILSQIVRGAAEAFAAGADVAGMLRGASDAAYAAVRSPVEGTMLTAIRELAEAAEAGGDVDAIIARGDDCVARTRTLLPALRAAGVVDAGAAGLVEVVRGLAGRGPAAPVPAAPARSATHELSRFRFCTSYVVEGERLDAEAIERELDALGDSVLVVGTATAVRVHVHTDEPERALRLGAARGAVEAVEVADMHEQIVERTHRLERPACAVVAVAAGDGNRRLLGSLGALVVDPAPTPTPAALLAAIEGDGAREAIVVATGRAALRAAERAAGRASKPVRVLPVRTLPAVLSALVAFDPERDADANLAAMRAAADAVAAGAVRARGGRWVGLVDGERVADAASFAEAAGAVVERLLAEPRSVLTLLAGEEAPALEPLLARLAERRPGLEVEVHAGGQPGDALLLGAE